MMKADSYGMGAGKSSAKETPKYKEGSLDAMQNNKAYRKDMYDKLARAPAHPSATIKPNNGIQGSGGQKVTKDVAVTGNNGSDDYGKGNPYKNKGDKKPKQVFKSIQDLKNYRDKGMKS